MTVSYICARCKARIKGKGFEAHYGSTRCNDRHEAYRKGFSAGESYILGKVEPELRRIRKAVNKIEETR